MKKTVFIIVSFVVMLLSMSASVDDNRFARLGSTAPAVILERDSSITSLEQLHGQKVILSFWSASDPESRLNQTKISRLINNTDLKHNNVAVLSVNLDRSEALMNEIIKIDNLDEASQFYVGSPDRAAALRDAYRMHRGLRTFIIDSDGRLIAADPTDSQLLQILS